MGCFQTTPLTPTTVPREGTVTLRNSRQQLLIDGFVRETVSQCDISDVPLAINDILCSFQRYYDKWSIKYTHHNILIDDDKTMITINDAKLISAFGAYPVSQGTFQWRLQLVKYEPNQIIITTGPPYVGVIKDSEDIGAYQNSAMWRNKGYQLCAGNGELFGDVGDEFRTNHGVEKCRCNKYGDIIEITLDLERRTLHFRVNDDNSNECWFSNIEKTHYRLALTNFEGRGSQFQIMTQPHL